MSKKKTIKIKTDSDSATEKTEADSTETAADGNQAPVNEAQGAQEVKGEQQPGDDLAARLEAKEQEARENYDRLLRVLAEFENYKKRTTREMEEFRKFANQSLIKEMLSVVDNLELALTSAGNSNNADKGLREGLEMTHREILRVLEKFHVRPIEAKGQPFDPAFHEAVMQEESTELPDNTVVNELQRGYMIHDRLLRPAMVVVAKSGKKKAVKPDKKQEKE